MRGKKNRPFYRAEEQSFYMIISTKNIIAYIGIFASKKIDRMS
jgi:hypothetical protein